MVPVCSGNKLTPGNPLNGQLGLPAAFHSGLLPSRLSPGKHRRSPPDARDLKLSARNLSSSQIWFVNPGQQGLWAQRCLPCRSGAQSLSNGKMHTAELYTKTSCSRIVMSFLLPWRQMQPQCWQITKSRCVDCNQAQIPLKIKSDLLPFQ